MWMKGEVSVDEKLSELGMENSSRGRQIPQVS